MLTKEKLIEEVQALRFDGFTIREICEKLNVTKSFAKHHTRTEAQKIRGRHLDTQWWMRNRAAVYASKKRYKEEFPARSVLRTIKSRCLKLGIPFSLDLNDYVGPYVCPVLGTEIDFGRTKSNNRIAASFDRIIPELGYVKANVRIISMKANQCKSDLTLQELQNLVEYVKKNTPGETSTLHL